MPHFTRQFTNGAPIIFALLSVTQARAAALASSKAEVPIGRRITAMIDTGASCTCVDPSIIAALGLSPTGSTQVFTPSTGAQGYDADQYDASIQIFSATQETPLEIPVLPIVASDLRAHGIDALIGRDVLRFCLFCYNGQSGFFTLAY